MLQNNVPLCGFDEMSLNPQVLNALKEVGYHTPTPIQARTIPCLARGRDVLGQARTGTGKTAAFALPLLSRIDLENKRPQVLVLTPTRELAIQVAESFKTYGAKMKKLNVLAVYGGQSYGVQLNQLKRGVHVVVGTPGRLMDHLRRKTLSLADLFCTVLDEADEMLHMGFIDDVEWILEKTPRECQTALFSATMPGPIRKISGKYLDDPEEIIVQSDKTELGTIDQQCWVVKGANKSLALVRILEAAAFDGVIVFVKTRVATLEVTKVLEEKGFKAEALNGELAQNARERTVNRLKNGRIDILVATDVAARGLDVDRISHVVNYDMPPKVEPYVHRIGRTGRAGRTGEAILFVRPNERWMLKKIEKTTKQKVREIFLPTNRDINAKRVENFKQTLTRTLESGDLTVFENLIQEFADQENIPVIRAAAALAKLAHGDAPFLLSGQETRTKEKSGAVKQKTSGPKNVAMKERPKRRGTQEKKSQKTDPGKNQSHRGNLALEKGMERYRIEVGSKHGVRSRDIVGAITNEAGLEGKYISNINISPDFSMVDLPFGMPKQVFKLLKKTWVRSHQMAISKCA
ncbi:DEAD/DEAH box helicase [Desulfospira joergensenii]|uniref:DEAD/DEAH box helicase n=1 Tax=Desulfospira joergensenii TaxID=53329 RepID=UPI0003B323F2|nr:DEAD/DEAH box helicase [Desulfospira joergensenii]